ncbi:MAG: DUF348 domain-containing protein [Clostridia bacterium]|nr:DUF348 domain-containing protein [Clostridia bacterium]
MKKEGKSSISIIKIMCVSLILIILSGAGVVAMTTQLNTVIITLSNGYEMTVLTNKTKVSEILKENNIVVQENERVTPSLDEEIDTNNTIKICDKSIQEIQVAKVSENGIETTLEDILNNYSPIIEKIVIEQESIPYETITKDVSNGEETTKNKVVTKGEEGIKQVTYKVKYKNDEEISRTKLSEIVIKDAVDKVVQVQKDVTTRSSTSRVPTKTAIFRVTGYCACSKCCGKFASGYTSSGTKATAGRTVAASTQYDFGTKLLINGSTYTVEDRGGAITGNKIDIYFNTHAEAIAWGVKYLPVEVIE